MDAALLQDEGAIEKMAGKQIEELLNDLVNSFKTLSEKEGVAQTDVQLAIRYDGGGRMSDFIKKQIHAIAGQSEWPIDGVQLVVGFKPLIADDPNGDCNFSFQIFKDWQLLLEQQWLDDKKKAALEAYLILRLGSVKNEFKIESWLNVTVIFHIQKEVLKMSIYLNEDGNPVHKRSFVLADEEIKDMSFIYFQLLKNFKVVRPANFSKDFLNHPTIMKDEKEDMIRLYLAGGNFNIPGIPKPIELPGNLDIVSEKHKLPWKQIAFIFSKKTMEQKPELGIYKVNKPAPAGEESLPEFEWLESVDIFSDHAEKKEGH